MYILLTAPMFGGKHLLGLLLLVILFGAISFFISKKEIKDQKVITIFAISFLVLEVIKLGYMIIRDGSFPMNHLPFHLCSLPLYLYPILAWVKNEKLVEFIKPAAFAGVLTGGMIALLYPVNIIGGENSWLLVEDNLMPFVSFLFHGLMLFAPFYLIRSGYYKFSFKKIKEVYMVLVLFMFMAIIVNLILGSDFMLLNTGNGSPLQFLIDSSQIVYTLSMIALGLFAILLFHSVGLLIRRNKDL